MQHAHIFRISGCSALRPLAQPARTTLSTHSAPRGRYEAIERTFKGVAKFFSDVFAELVPGLRGSAHSLVGPARAFLFARQTMGERGSGISRIRYMRMSAVRQEARGRW